MMSEWCKGYRGERFINLTKLRVVKRLMDKGFRLGKVIALDAEALLRVLKSHLGSELERHLKNLLIEQGLEKFVQDTRAEMNTQVGDAWCAVSCLFSRSIFIRIQRQVLIRGRSANSTCRVTRSVFC